MLRIPVRRILITIGLLALSRLGLGIALPGINVTTFAHMGSGAPSLAPVSIFALGLNPYITALVIAGLVSRLTMLFQKEAGAATRRRSRVTVGLMVCFCLVQGFALGTVLKQTRVRDVALVTFGDDADSSTYALVVALTLTAGSLLVLWVARQITTHGVCDGTLLLYGMDLLETLVRKSRGTFSVDGEGLTPLAIFRLGCLLVGFVFIACRVERAVRVVPVEKFAEPIVLKPGRQALWAPVFMSSLLVLPLTVGAWIPSFQILGEALMSDAWRFDSVYFAGIVVVGYLLAQGTFDATKTAENLRENGGRIADIPAGQETVHYLARLHSRISLGYAFYIAVMCVVPTALLRFFHIDTGITGLLLLLLVKAGTEIAEKVFIHPPATTPEAQPA
jgi:preprotein translocase subunit SecY